METDKIALVGYSSKSGSSDDWRVLKSTLYNPKRGEVPIMAEAHKKLKEVDPDMLILEALSIKPDSLPSVDTKYGRSPVGSAVAIQQKKTG